ncbi:DUF4188 domain-containing protein [Kitasatospora sp. NPDC058032]|uniref:DUF4188 domain-containing protein n=1 Tax=Kitasatospora sp. NPDC058032 TaxID=3346307 RepID=UPI0036DED0C9
MAATLIRGRTTADHEGSVVVFHIGMRINRFRALRSWWPASAAMPRMLKELAEDPHSGLLGYRMRLGLPRVLELVQYWESPEKLLAYAADQDQEHRPAWAAFNRLAREGAGNVGIWHETFVVPAGSHEAIYIDMPPYGLAEATGTVPVARRGETARERMGRPAAP